MSESTKVTTVNDEWRAFDDSQVVDGRRVK